MKWSTPGRVHCSTSTPLAHPPNVTTLASTSRCAEPSPTGSVTVPGGDAIAGSHPKVVAKVSTVLFCPGKGTPAKFTPPSMGTVRSASPCMLSTLVDAPAGGSHLDFSAQTLPAKVAIPANDSGAWHAIRLAMNPPVAMPKR